MGDYDEALAVERVGDGRWTGRLSDSWSIGGAVNGGILMALTTVALGRDVLDGSPEHVAPLAYSAHFLSASSDGPATMRTEVIRRGRSLTTGQVSLYQDVEGEEVERLRALVGFGSLHGRADPHLRSTAAPSIPPPEQCTDSSLAPAALVASVPLLGRIDLRLDPATSGWAVGAPSGEGRMQGWIRFADDRPVDATSLLFFLDALPPVSFDLGIMGWAPTLEFSGHIRAEAAPGWLQVELRTSNVAGGFMEEDATVWDSTGRLVAQSRQLAGIRIPDPT
jgi:acyl-CoA thioesterase